jgi:hypothetical protein
MTAYETIFLYRVPRNIELRSSDQGVRIVDFVVNVPTSGGTNDRSTRYSIATGRDRGANTQEVFLRPACGLPWCLPRALLRCTHTRSATSSARIGTGMRPSIASMVVPQPETRFLCRLAMSRRSMGPVRKDCQRLRQTFLQTPGGCASASRAMGTKGRSSTWFSDRDACRASAIVVVDRRHFLPTSYCSTLAFDPAPQRWQVLEGACDRRGHWCYRQESN